MGQYDHARKRTPSLARAESVPGRTPLVVSGLPLTVWICSKELTEVVVHYSGVRTFGCYVVHGSGACPGCQGRWPRTKQWWLSVCFNEGADSPVELLKLTAVAVQSAPELVTDSGSLWGRRLKVWRHPGGPCDPMYAEVLRDESPRDLPDCEPTLWALIRMWQAKTKAETLVKYGLREGRPPAPPEIGRD